MIDKITKAENYIIGLFDRATTAMQRRGWLPLNTLIMANECLFWATAIVMNAGDGWVVVTLLFAGPSLYFAYQRWSAANGYWENYRKMQSLNANVVFIRSLVGLRWAGIAPVVLVVSVNVLLLSLAWGVNACALFGIMYLSCCHYLGPGDFARKRQEIPSGAWQESQ